LSAVLAAVVLVAVSLAAGTGEPALRAAQTQDADPASSLRTPWGEPDFQGIWSVALLVPLERPEGVTTEFYTAERQAELDRQRAGFSVFGNHVRAERGTEADVAGAYNAVFTSQRPTGRRTGMVIDPPAGRVPPMTPEAQARQAEIDQYQQALMQNTVVCRDGLPGCPGEYGPPSPRREEQPPYYSVSNINRADGPEDRSLGERCMSGNLPTFRGGFAGIRRAGLLGGFAAWLAFTLPSATALILFAYGVRSLGDQTDAGWLQGLKVVAVAVVALARWGMARTLAPDRPRITIAVLAAIALLAAPGMPMLVAVSADLRQKSRRHSVGLRYHKHRTYAEPLILGFEPYDHVAAHVIPDDAVVALWGIGVRSYYAPNVTVIDLHGLVDPVVARNPSGRGADDRVIAHDRKPPPGYLRRRGPNLMLRVVQPSDADALTHANYAVRIGDRQWMPFDVVDHAWANQNFSDLHLRATHRYSQTDPAANRFTVDGTSYVGQQFLGRFEENRMDGWTMVGKAVSNHALNPFLDTSAGPTSGHVGPGYLTTYFPGKWERFGHVRSPAFTATSDQYLAFLIAGESHDQVGLRLLAEGAEIAVWRGDDREAFELVLYPLQKVAGQELQLEIFNHEIGDRPRLMLDHVMLVRQEAPDR